MRAAAILIFALLFSLPAMAQQQARVTGPSIANANNLTTGGTAQNLFAAGEVGRGCAITNPSTATERIWVNFATTAQQGIAATDIPVEIGSSMNCPPGPLTNAVSWIAATTNHQIVASQY